MYNSYSGNNPLSSLKKYLGKLHTSCPAFFQRPKVKHFLGSPTWYCNSPVGVNPLGKMMEKICELANLKTKYTNHSIWATMVTTLRNSGAPIQDKMSVTGHKNAQRVNSYSRTDYSDRAKMSQVMSEKTVSSQTARIDFSQINIPSNCLGEELCSIPIQRDHNLRWSHCSVKISRTLMGFQTQNSSILTTIWVQIPRKKRKNMYLCMATILKDISYPKKLQLKMKVILLLHKNCFLQVSDLFSPIVTILLWTFTSINNILFTTISCIICVQDFD